jgi:serine-type D-Ala-D-Ala carboxypeptidase
MKNQINIYLEEVCRKGLSEGVFSGVSAGVSICKDGVHHRGFFSGGWTRLDQAGMRVQGKTLFDLASLTKPLCTTLCVLHLIALGKLRWNEKCLSSFNVEISREKKKIEIQHLLNHSSGLPSYRPYFQEFLPEYFYNNKALLIQKILNEPLQYATGSTSLYSDLGFILLGALVENITGVSLDFLYRKIIINPLTSTLELSFLPLEKERKVDEELVAATENCGWRNKQVQGEVHDEHSWLMGGVAGHAGLFGNIEGVMTLCEHILDIWKDRAVHPAFPNSLLQRALEKKDTKESWCYGFDTPSGFSSSGRYFSSQSVGHLGFSGTSFWIDPEKDIVIVLLTNRIYPTRNNIKIREYRPFFHNYLMEKIESEVKF